MRILLLSTTGQPEANLESTRYLIEQKSTIDKITILSSHLMKVTGKTELLIQSLSSIFQGPIEVIDIPQGHEENDMLAIQHLIINWINTHHNKDTFVFNITGGTKLMSLALDRASIIFGASRTECFYQNREHKIVWYQRKDNKIAYPILSNLDLKQRMLSRGYHIEKQHPITEISANELQYAQILINLMQSDFHKGRNFCSFINWVAGLLDKQKTLSITIENISSEQIEGLSVLAKITDEAFFRFDASTYTVHFQSETTRQFMKGGWLEVYTGYEFYRALISFNPQAELAINVELKKKDTPNEMDVMFIHQANLYCIECKTAKTMAEQSAKDVLYKLSALQDFGGLNQKQAVVSLYSLKNYNLTRAENADIKIFQEKDLLNLSEHILEWLSPKEQKNINTISL